MRTTDCAVLWTSFERGARPAFPRRSYVFRVAPQSRADGDIARDLRPSQARADQRKFLPRPLCVSVNARGESAANTSARCG